MFDETLEISLVMLMFLGEFILALLVLVGILFLMNRAKKVLVEKLLAKLKAQEEAHEEPEEVAINPVPSEPVEQELTYTAYLEDALENTKEHYHLCFGAEKILLDRESSVDQQVVALRHAFLFAEKTLLRYDDKTNEFWGQLKNRLKKILLAYDTEEAEAEENDVDVEGLENEITSLKQRINNLEMFKKLFFDLQSKCQDIHNQGEEIHQQAQAIAQTIEGGEELQLLLDQYQSQYNELGSAVDTTPHAEVHVHKGDKKSVTQIVQVNTRLDEINQLKSVADNQHNIITKLRGELIEFQNASGEEVAAAAEKIEENMHQLEKSLAESEMCVQMLEGDYHEAMEQVHALETQLASLSTDNSALSEALEESKDTGIQMERVAQESKEMVGCISTLEDENEMLAMQVKRLKIKLKAKKTATSSGGDDHNLKTQVVEKDKEIMKLKNDYAILEGQYLDVFQKLNS